MSMGYALTERYPIDENCRPTVKFGTLGLFRANQIPEIKPIIVEKPGLNVGGGAIGIGEITSIPTAPAIAEAYRRYDGELRTRTSPEKHPLCKKMTAANRCQGTYTSRINRRFRLASKPPGCQCPSAPERLSPTK